MAVPTKTIIDCSTGVVSEIPLTDEEMAQQAADATAFAAKQADDEAAATAKATALSSAESKLATLGLTADEIKALFN